MIKMLLLIIRLPGGEDLHGRKSTEIDGPSDGTHERMYRLDTFLPHFLTHAFSR